MSSADHDEVLIDNESDDDDLWDEVVVPQEPALVQAPTGYDQLADLEPQAGPSTRPNIEITLKKAHVKTGKGKDSPAARYVGFEWCVDIMSYQIIYQEDARRVACGEALSYRRA